MQRLGRLSRAGRATADVAGDQGFFVAFGAK
jgi:hypothetical protein